MFYDQFKDLCLKRGISCNKAAIEIGLSNATPTKWKKTGATPDGSTLAKIASYFNVSVDYLLGQDQKEKPDTDPDDELKNLDSASKSKLIVLARHLDKVPDAQRERLLKNFEESIDIYLDAMGIPKEDE